jgi:hypothetical protein
MASAGEQRETHKRSTTTSGSYGESDWRTLLHGCGQDRKNNLEVTVDDSPLSFSGPSVKSLPEHVTIRGVGQRLVPLSTTLSHIYARLRFDLTQINPQGALINVKCRAGSYVPDLEAEHESWSSTWIYVSLLRSYKKLICAVLYSLVALGYIYRYMGKGFEELRHALSSRMSLRNPHPDIQDTGMFLS